MKTRESSTEPKLESLNKNFKKRHQKNIKTKQISNGLSYCDTHNIGKRKSNSNVVTYSLNSHLFFDVYAKFDQNSVTKYGRQSPYNLIEIPTAKVSSQLSSVSDDLSKYIISKHDDLPRKSSPKRLNVLCEAQPVNKDESLIPSPHMERILPFRFPRATLSNYKSHPPLISTENQRDIPHTNTETFQRILDNKTVFKKHLSEVKIEKKLKRLPSTSIKKTVTKSSITMANGSIYPSNKIRLSRSNTKNFNPNMSEENKLQAPSRQKRMASLNAAAIINCVQSQFKGGRKLSKSRMEGRRDSENIMLQLDTEESSTRTIGVGKSLMKSESLHESVDLKTERTVMAEIKYRPRRGRPRLERRQARVAAFRRMPCEKEAPIARIIIKAESEELTETQTLWSWDGDAQDRMVQLQLGGVAAPRQCYPAIRHNRDHDVVIRVTDCVMLRSGGQHPYLARITAFFDDVESKRKMMTILWYYRPEHTDQGRLPWHTDMDVYASKHLDTNSLDCIEDKAFVLCPELYCRFIADQSRQRSMAGPSLATRIVPWISDGDVSILDRETRPRTLPQMDLFVSDYYYSQPWQATFPAEMTTANVFVCRGLYDITQHKVTRNIVALLQSPVRERCASPDSETSSSSKHRTDITYMHTAVESQADIIAETSLVSQSPSITSSSMAHSNQLLNLPSSQPSSTSNNHCAHITASIESVLSSPSTSFTGQSLWQATIHSQ